MTILFKHAHSSFQVTDFVIILNTRSAVDAFSKGGNLTLGGNFTIAVGPLGRNAEADVSVRSPAAIYTYSKTKGLFAGISIEGSALIERKDANKKYVLINLSFLYWTNVFVNEYNVLYFRHGVINIYFS